MTTEHEQAVLDLATMTTECHTCREWKRELPNEDFKPCSERVAMFSTLRVECPGTSPSSFGGFFCLRNGEAGHGRCSIPECDGRGWLPVDDLQVLMDALEAKQWCPWYSPDSGWVVWPEGTSMAKIGFWNEAKDDLFDAARDALNAAEGNVP